MFSERLLGSYKENFESYQNASLVENAYGLRHKKYMLIHGMFDSNVHFQHSAMLSKELQHKSIAFEQQVRLLKIVIPVLFFIKLLLLILFI